TVTTGTLWSSCRITRRPFGSVNVLYWTASFGAGAGASAAGAALGACATAAWPSSRHGRSRASVCFMGTLDAAERRGRDVNYWGRSIAARPLARSGFFRGLVLELRPTLDGGVELAFGGRQRGQAVLDVRVRSPVELGRRHRGLQLRDLRLEAGDARR